MDNEFSFEITNKSKNTINEILKQQGLRHFKLYTDFYGELDVINYEEYEKLEKEKDKEIERLKAREEECMNAYLRARQDVSEYEGKYVLAKYVIDKLEKYLEEEQIRLARENSNFYEDSLGKTRLVNDDIFNEITRIKDKLKALKEGKE